MILFGHRVDIGAVMADDASQANKAATGGGLPPPRVIRANRSQPVWDSVDPETWLPQDDMARTVWAYVEALDLHVLYDRIKARGSAPGRSAADPAIQLALWLLATIDGIGSARELERCCRERLPYMWLRHGVPVNYHGLADFRLAHADVLDDLLTKHLAVLVAAEIVSVDDIIVDGTKIAASAGKNTYRRAKSLGEIETATKARVTALKAEVEADPAAGSKRQAAAKARAARETAERAERAKKMLAAIEAEREERAKTSPKEVGDMKEPRASTTDPEARKMRCADGTVRPAYNIQVAVTADHGLITGIQATDRRQDSGLARQMIAETERRTGRPAKRLLADTGYASQDDIVALATRTDNPVESFVSLPKEQENVKPATLKERERKRAKEPEAIKHWRERMTTEAAKEVMKKRSGIEKVNAQMKHRGLARVHVRGLAQVQTLALWQALAHNFTTGLRLLAAAAKAVIPTTTATA